jgi:hypothetical protein
MTECLLGQVCFLYHSVLGEIGSRRTEETALHILIGLGLDELRLTSALRRGYRRSRPCVMKRGDGWFEKASWRS